jgi:tetratricopeptide (TPR) repeat protein
MILRPPSLIRLCVYLALFAGNTAGRAEPESHPTPAPEQSAPPADPAEHPALTSETLPHGSAAGGPGHTAVKESVHEQAAASETRPAGHTDQVREAGHAAPSAAKPVHAAEGGREEIVSLQKLGTRLTERGDLDAAEIAYRQIMASREATQDDLANALLGLARVYRKQGSLTKAAAIYEKYLKDYPAHENVPDAYLELGRTHRALGAHQLALARFYSVINSTLKLSSEGFEHYQVLAKTAQFEIAETHFQQGNYAEANKYFSRLRLLDLAPADRARAHFKSADALYLSGDLDGAVKALRSFLELSPQDENVPEARYLLALSLRSLGRKQEALDATLELLRTEQTMGDPKRWSYWQRRTGNQLANEFFQAGDTLNALVIYQGLAALSPEPAWRLPVTYQIALCYERMRTYDRAITAYQSIIDGANPPATAPAAGETKPAEPAKPANTEIAELVRMATWRLSQLNWHEQTERQLSSIFNSNAEPAPKTVPAAAPLAPNIESNAPSQPTAAPVHDQPGKPATTSANL